MNDKSRKSKSTLQDAPFDDTDNASSAERHHQIMEEAEMIYKFIKRAFYGCLMIVVLIVGFLIFMYNNKSEFWRYP
jgi:flagellar biosynthesis/type III secretory pathway M-ring protein FliF/YscJ